MTEQYDMRLFRTPRKNRTACRKQAGGVGGAGAGGKGGCKREEELGPVILAQQTGGVVISWQTRGTKKRPQMTCSRKIVSFGISFSASLGVFFFFSLSVVTIR